jgi:ubiquinone/menaquinone biosynthesis C-methylase UbiE
MPLPDAGADAVIASSSWHWMDPVPTLTEVGRVLVPAGTADRCAQSWGRSGPSHDQRGTGLSGGTTASGGA